VRDGAPAFVFDLMEPERPKVDRAVLAFMNSEPLHPADFTIRADGVVGLNPELARTVVGLAAAPGLIVPRTKFSRRRVSRAGEVA